MPNYVTFDEKQLRFSFNVCLIKISEILTFEIHLYDQDNVSKI